MADVHFIVVFNRIPALIASVEATSRSAPKRVADKIAVDARARAPVATGYLRSSIKSVSTAAGKSADVRADASYAAFVEYGTYKMAAQPFLYPAFQAHADELSMALGAAAGGAGGVRIGS